VGKNDARQNNGPVSRNYGDEPVAVPFDVENVARPDPVNRAAVSGSDILKSSPTRSFDDSIPRKKLFLRVGMDRPEFSKSPARDDAHLSPPRRDWTAFLGRYG
jgi:hypothetical protein